jgi:small subunit ribosomal protein S20
LSIELYGRTVTLANTKSALKRIRMSEKRRERNTSYNSRVKTMLKKAEQTVASGNADPAAITAAISTLDKAAVKGIIHKNNAARRKSRLMKKVNAAAK